MKNPAIIGIYGESNTGKTTLIVDIIKQFTKEGYQIATLKITDKKVKIDTKGKDTWKYTIAGSKNIALSTPIQTIYIANNFQNIDEIIKQLIEIGRHDLILIEGANDNQSKKIRLGKIKERKNTIMTYDGNDKQVFEKIKQEINNNKKKNDNIEVKVNGIEIPVSEFPSEFIKNTIIGMLKSLKGIEKIENVDISF